MKTVLFSLFIVLFFSACSHTQNTLSHNLNKEEGIYSIKQAKKIDIQELVKELEHYPIIFVGDHHNNKKTHKFFEELLKAMDKQGYNLNLANEWFTPEHDKILKLYTDNWLDGIRLKERRYWNEFTKYKWEYVEPLYEAVKSNGGKLYGMNISKKERKKISLNQVDKMDKELKTFYDALDVDVSAHRQLIMPYLKHCDKMPSKSSEPCDKRMYRIQVTWDTYMAKNVAKIAKEVIKTPKDKLFVFAGALHVEQNLGIPLRFSRLSNLPFITISNERISKEKDIKIDTNKADFIYIYKK